MKPTPPSKILSAQSSNPCMCSAHLASASAACNAAVSAAFASSRLCRCCAWLSCAAAASCATDRRSTQMDSSSCRRKAHALNLHNHQHDTRHRQHLMHICQVASKAWLCSTKPYDIRPSLGSARIAYSTEVLALPIWPLPSRGACVLPRLGAAGCC